MRDGLPSWVYTADQTRVASAAEPPNAPFGQAAKKDPTARGDREHSTMLGNSRIVLIASNYGHWRIRQDEGGPKWLTDSDVDDEAGHRFGGGVAFVLQDHGNQAHDIHNIQAIIRESTLDDPSRDGLSLRPTQRPQAYEQPSVRPLRQSVERDLR